MSKADRLHFYTEWNLPPDAGIDCQQEPSVTQQHFKDECDINNIMAQYEATGLLRVSSNYATGRYADLADVEDYHTSLNKVIAAQEAFDDLPSALRSRFDNDPAKFLEFVTDNKNADELVSLGLANPRPKPVSSEPSTGGAHAGSSDKPSAGAPPVGGSESRL